MKQKKAEIKLKIILNEELINRKILLQLKKN